MKCREHDHFTHRIILCIVLSLVPLTTLTLTILLVRKEYIDMCILSKLPLINVLRKLHSHVCIIYCMKYICQSCAYLFGTLSIKQLANGEVHSAIDSTWEIWDQCAHLYVKYWFNAHFSSVVTHPCDNLNFIFGNT